MIRPEDLWEIDSEYADDYASTVASGRAVACTQDAVVVAIARNSMPHMTNTLALLDEVQKGFRSCRFFCFENDSTDDTAEVLDAYAAARDWATVEHQTFSRPDVRGFEKARTEALAEYRNRCQDWVRENASSVRFTIVLDMDPHGGFSVDGVFHSVARLIENQGEGWKYRAGAMASFSLISFVNEGVTQIAQYDAWAARPLSWWRDRRNEIGMNWFHLLVPPTGSPVMPMNSAFGGLAVYDTQAYLSGRYTGDDCEHVGLHRSMRRAGWCVYLNPGCRYYAVIQ